MYFLAVVATSLRYDARNCIVIGVLAIVQYGGLWMFAAMRNNLHDAAYLPEAGPYDAVDCATRLILLSVATILSVTIVRRAQRLLYLAWRDRLTGLYNRGHFDRALAAAIDTAAREGLPLALALLQTVSKTPIIIRGGEILRMNFSAGLAGIPDDAVTVSPKDLVTLADPRLLTAKRNGRGRCIGSEEAGVSSFHTSSRT